MVDNCGYAGGNDVGDLCDLNTEDLLISSQSLTFLEHITELNVHVQSPIMPVPTPEHWNKYPNMDIINSKYCFDMHIDSVDNQNWLYNPKKNKVFTKINSVMTVSVSYKPYNTSDHLYLRAMIVYTSPDDMHLQVKRCAHHKLEKGEKDVPSEHFLKCFHPNTKYVGNENSRLFGDRLSVLVPLGRPVVGEHGIATESLMLAFRCQNSCATGINRKSTAVLFTLENEQYEIVGKSVMPFKVCSCPKRDMQREDIAQPSRKREYTDRPHGKRPSKMMCLDEIKVEPPTPSPVKNTEPPFADTPHTVVLTMPNKDTMQHVLRCAFNEVTGMIARDKTGQTNNYMRYADKIKETMKSLQTEVNTNEKM